MKIVQTNNINKFSNKKIELRGWAYTTRSSGKIGFLIFHFILHLLQP